MRGMAEKTANSVAPCARPDPSDDLTLHHGSGPFRTRLPHYVSLKPPLQSGLPPGDDIQAWLAFVQAGECRHAWETLIADNTAGDTREGLLSPARDRLQPVNWTPRYRSTRS